MSPYRTDVVEVTVPPSAVTSTRWAEPSGVAVAPTGTPRASLSQLQATSGSSGSMARAASTSAWRNATRRMVPFHASCPAGSNSRMRRPKALPCESVGTTSRSSGGRTSAPTA